MSRSNNATLDALITEATADCYNDSECVTGFYTVLDDNLAMPFQTVVLGVDVTVAGIDLTDDEQTWPSACAVVPHSASQSWTLRCLHRSPTALSGSQRTAAG